MSGAPSSGKWSPALVLGLAFAGIVVGVSIPSLRDLTVAVVAVIVLGLLLSRLSTIRQQVASL